MLLRTVPLILLCATAGCRMRQKCEHGAEMPCRCEGGVGAQRCEQDKGFGMCECPAAPAAPPGAAAAAPSSAPFRLVEELPPTTPPAGAIPATAPPTGNAAKTAAQRPLAATPAAAASKAARAAAAAPPAAAAPALGQPGLLARPIKERLDAVDLQVGMRRADPGVRGCYQRLRVAGVAAVTATVGPDGRVASASVTGPLAGSPTGECVAGAVRRLATFPSFRGPPIVTSHSYTLR
jgi:hypothetical protein